jgi:cytochrome P450
MSASEDLAAESGPAPDPSWHGLELGTGAAARADEFFPALHRLRERAPVNLTPIGLWRLSRYRDCVRLLRDVPCGVRHLDGCIPMSSRPLEEQGGEFMLEQDPPDHTRLRKLVSKAFTPRAVAGWRSRAEAITADCLAPVLESGRLDVVADLALPVPATLICEMLGVPLADRDRFAGWTADATHGLAGDLATPETRAQAVAGAKALAAYFQSLIAERRARPGDDLLTVLIEAEEEGERLSSQELLVQSIGLLVAGFETTIGLIANGVAALCRHPGEQARLRAEPERIENAVEECLRYDPPVGVTMRVLHEDALFGGYRLPKDAVVWAMLRAANHDPEVFPDPDRFDVGRQGAREHLAFGGGTHHCLGAHLARMEAQVAIGALVSRTRELALESDEIEWGRSLFRVPARLPVALRAA